MKHWDIQKFIHYLFFLLVNLFKISKLFLLSSIQIIKLPPLVLKSYINFVFFFYNNSFGYFLFNVFLLYGVFGCDQNTCNKINVFCCVFYLIILILIVDSILFLNISFIKKLVISVVGVEFLSKYSNCLFFSKFVLYILGPLFLFTFIHMITCHLNFLYNMELANFCYHEYFQSVNSSAFNHDENSIVWKEVVQKADAYMNTRPKGIFEILFSKFQNLF